MSTSELGSASFLYLHSKGRLGRLSRLGRHVLPHRASLTLVLPGVLLRLGRGRQDLLRGPYSTHLVPVQGGMRVAKWGGGCREVCPAGLNNNSAAAARPETTTTPTSTSAMSRQRATSTAILSTTVAVGGGGGSASTTRPQDLPARPEEKGRQDGEVGEVPAQLAQVPARLAQHALDIAQVARL